MGARFRLVVMLVGLVALAALGVASVAGAAAPRCRATRSARCLRLARGHEPVIVSAAAKISRNDALQAFVQAGGTFTVPVQTVP